MKFGKLIRRFWTCLRKWGVWDQRKDWKHLIRCSVALTAHSLNGLFDFFPTTWGEWCNWLLHWSPAHSHHMFIISISETTDLIWILTKIWGKLSCCFVPAFRITLIGPLGNDNYCSKQGAMFITDWPRQGLHHSWGDNTLITALLKPFFERQPSPGLWSHCLFVLLAVKNALLSHLYIRDFRRLYGICS